MHPVSTLLLVIGYGLALPVALRAGRIPTRLRRLGLAGHQMGMIIAALGWAVRSNVVLAVVHLVWALVAKIVITWMLRRQMAERAA